MGITSTCLQVFIGFAETHTHTHTWVLACVCVIWLMYRLPGSAADLLLRLWSSPVGADRGPTGGQPGPGGLGRPADQPADQPQPL